MFVIGGVTFSETRSAYEVSEAYKSCEVVIGKLALGKGAVCAVLRVGLQNVRIILLRAPLLVHHANTIARVFLKTMHFKSIFAGYLKCLMFARIFFCHKTLRTK